MQTTIFVKAVVLLLFTSGIMQTACTASLQKKGGNPMTPDPQIYLDKTGIFSAASPQNNSDRWHTYHIHLATGSPVNFYVRSSDFAPHLQVFFADQLVAEAHGEAFFSNISGEPEFWEISILHTAARTGPYRLEITSTKPGETGQYVISATGAFSEGQSINKEEK